MAQKTVDEKQQAHELIDQLPPAKLTVVVSLLTSMLDPVSRAIANAPIDDEPETAEEAQAAREGKIWFEKNGGKGIPHEEVLADFGLTPDDFKNLKD